MKAKKNITVYIVDDDPVYATALEKYMQNELSDISVKKFSTGEACLHAMSPVPDIIILDYRLNSEFSYAWDGLQMLQKLTLYYPAVVVIMLSSQQNIETAMNTINEGAYQYIVKNKKAFSNVKMCVLDLAETIRSNSDEENRQHGSQMAGIVLFVIVASVLLLALTDNSP